MNDELKNMVQSTIKEVAAEVKKELLDPFVPAERKEEAENKLAAMTRKAMDEIPLKVANWPTEESAGRMFDE